MRLSEHLVYARANGVLLEADQFFRGLNPEDWYTGLGSCEGEIDEDAWAGLNSNTARPFEEPNSGRVSVKAINYQCDEEMKVYGLA